MCKLNLNKKDSIESKQKLKSIMFFVVFICMFPPAETLILAFC